MIYQTIKLYFAFLKEINLDLVLNKKLTAFSWPGNVRQLRNTIHRACVLATSNSLQARDLPLFQEAEVSFPPGLLDMSLDEIERLAILENLNRFNQNKTQTAQRLGITTRTLSNKLKLYEEQKRLNAAHAHDPPQENNALLAELISD